MKKNRKKWMIVLCLVMLIGLLPCGHADAADTADDESLNPKHILYISSYSYSWGTVPLQIKGINRALQGADYVINYEFMDTKNTVYSKGYREFYDLLKYKLATRYHYDGVIVGDDAALNFVMEYRDDLFAGTPITFLAVDNIENGEKASQDPKITGIVEQVDYQKNLEIAHRLLPDATRITFILDNMENGIGIARQLEKKSSVFASYQIQYLNTSEYTRKELCAKLASFTDQDIVFFVSMGQQKNGIILTENERYQMIRQYASVPMFRLTSAGVGDGALGGYVVDFEQSGYIAGQMLKEMLEHPEAKAPDMRYDTPGMYYFDYTILHKYGLKRSLLPEDAIVLNEPESVWKTYSNQIIIGLLLVILAVFGIFLCLIQRAQRKIKAKNQELMIASRAKTDFLSNMSHDMRTPMNAILGITALLHTRTDPEDMRRDIDQIEQSGRYLLSLINDTLDMNKIESGKMELHLKPIRTKAIVDIILSNVKALAEQKGIRFVAEIPPDDSPVWTTVRIDASRVEQIFINLLSNAIKFTPKGGTVTLRMEMVSITPESVRNHYVISDTGIGMSQEFQKHLFEPFSQEGRANVGYENGTGLGLAIVKHIVDLMGGSIAITSEPDRGTTVTLEFTNERCSDEEISNEQQKTDLNVLQGKHVLLCEDHPLNAEIARRMLEARGMTADLAQNGKAGVALFANAAPHTYDLILMDIRMPIMDGLDATRAIRSLEGRVDAGTIPIIAMTANTFDEDVKRCLEAGMNGHIAKPIEPTQMFEQLAQILTASETAPNQVE